MVQGEGFPGHHQHKHQEHYHHVFQIQILRYNWSLFPLAAIKVKMFFWIWWPLELSAYSKFGHFVALPQPQKHKSQGFSPWTSVEHPPFAGNAGECHEPDATGSASPRGGAVVEVIFYGCNHGQIHRKILGSDWKIIYTRAIIGRNWGLLPGITMGLKPP